MISDSLRHYLEGQQSYFLYTNISRGLQNND